MTFAKPAQGEGDPSAILARLSSPNAGMAKAITLGMQKLAFVAQKERFTGQGPFPVAQQRLGNVTGRLKRDIHAENVVISGNGYSGRIGSAVEYFAAHEMGFSGIVDVKAHVRQPSRKPIAGPWAVRQDGSLTLAAQRGSFRPGSSLRLPSSVRAHKRNLNIPARKPLRTAITEHGGEIIGAEIRKEVRR